MAPRSGVEVVSLNLSLRLYLLRTLTISSLFIISINIGSTLEVQVKPLRPGLWIALYTFITVHQIISALKWPIFYYGALEFPLLVVEVIGAGHYAKRVLVQSWQPEALVFHAVLAWLVVVALSLTVCFRMVDAIRSRGYSLISPFDILSHERKPSQSNHLKHEGISTFNILFGRSIWRKNFVGETVSLRTARGIFAIIVLSAVLFYTLLSVIFSPVKETALSPVKSFRIPGITPYDLLESINPPAWSVTYPLALQRSLTNGTNLTSLISHDVFFSAVTVTAVWPVDVFAMNSSKTTIPTLPLPVCKQKTEDSSGSNRLPYFFYSCPAVIIDQAWLLPDLDINVDFGPLTAGLSGMFQFSARTQLPLVIGLSNELLDDLTHTVPVTMIPGVNIIAPYIVGVRQVYVNGAWAAFGIFDFTKSFWLPNIVGFYPDPTATFTGINRSSLNIFSQLNFGETNFVQDYRENSVIAGLSAVGGLWTAFSGIFTIIFGASLLHTFYGTKPLSIFGIAHRFQAETMKKECLEKYPRILNEDRSLADRGLLSLLRDHLIDLDFVEDEKDSSEDYVSEGDMKSALLAVPQAPV